MHVTRLPWTSQLGAHFLNRIFSYIILTYNKKKEDFFSFFCFEISHFYFLHITSTTQLVVSKQLSCYPLTFVSQILC